jgi:PAS domain S-box-containing protein
MKPTFEAIAENSPDAIARFDRRGRLLYINPPMQRLLGRGDDPLLGEAALALPLAHASADALARALEDVRQSGRPLARTFTDLKPGEHYEGSLVPEFDEQQQVIGVLIMLRDVTERMRAAEALRKQRDFAEEVVNTVREPMLVLDSQFRVQSANRSFEQFFQLPGQELAGEPLHEVLDGRFDAPGLTELLQRVIGPQRSTFDGFDVVMNVPDRGQRTMRLNARQIDHLQLILLAMEDVTQQVETFEEMAADLKQWQDELTTQSRRLRELVVELSDTEDRERRRLADLLHDDLQQMLVGISFHLELAQQKCGDDSEAGSMLSEARNLLQDAIARSRNLSHELSPTAFRDRPLADSLHWLADKMRQQHGLEVKLRVDGVIEGLSEPVRVLLYKAIREMLFNIVKHAEVREANVKIHRQDGQLEVQVTDHGKGFDAEAVLENRSGQGLGLFSLRQRLEMLGGQLHVESTRGAGSKFRLTVPVIDPHTGGGSDSDDITAGAGQA